MIQRCFLFVVTLSLSIAQPPFGNALRFNGEQQYLEIPDTSYLNFDASNALCIEFLFKPLASKPASLFSKWERISDTEGRGIQGKVFTSNTKVEGKIRYTYLDPFEGFYSDDGVSILAWGDWSKATSTRYPDLELGEWYHVACIWGEYGYRTVYINGSSGGSGSGTPTHTDTPGQPLFIGGFPLVVDTLLDSTYYFSGSIDEFRVWNVYRSETDIIANMYDTVDVNTPGLVAYYRFDEIENLGIGPDNEVDDIRDYTNNGNHGDLHGNPVLDDTSQVLSIQNSLDHTPAYDLIMNYPNPFNPQTRIRFILAQSTEVNLTIFDISGRQVGVFTDSNMPAGEHEIEWGADDISSGIYFCHLRTRRTSQTIKMVLQK